MTAFRSIRVLSTSVLVAGLCSATGAFASSHREAPAITSQPKVDATDFYMFRSYEPGRQDFVTIVANYLPLQDPYGGPNYFTLDENALYEIHIDNDGDSLEDITFQFRFRNEQRCLTLPVGNPGDEIDVAVPIINIGPITRGDESALNVLESYTLDVVFGDRRSGSRAPTSNAATGSATFRKPVDNIGNKSIADYTAYASTFLYDIELPGTAVPGRVFVGQRKDSFVVNLGETFDLVNVNPVGPEDGERDDLADKNVTSFIVELPIDFLLGAGNDPVIGGWTTASLPQARVLNPSPASGERAFGAQVAGGAFTQVSRLGAPLINEVIVGLKDKDRFNASEPQDDIQFLRYVTNPTLPEILEVLFGVTAPNLFPRADLIAAFLTGVGGLNQPLGGVPSEMLRLNTAIDPTPACDQSRLGVLGGDLAGFPNGRRPGDDVVDIELRVAMGILLPAEVAPSGQLPYTDGAIIDAEFFDVSFPYLRNPIPGSPSDAVYPTRVDNGCDDVTPTESRVVFRNLGPDAIGLQLVATNQLIANGQIFTLPAGRDFSQSFDTALEGLNVILFFPGGGEVDQGLDLSVPLGRKQVIARDGASLLLCDANLDEECSPMPQ